MYDLRLITMPKVCVMPVKSRTDWNGPNYFHALSGDTYEIIIALAQLKVLLFHINKISNFAYCHVGLMEIKSLVTVLLEIKVLGNKETL